MPEMRPYDLVPPFRAIPLENGIDDLARPDERRDRYYLVDGRLLAFGITLEGDSWVHP